MGFAEDLAWMLQCLQFTITILQNIWAKPHNPTGHQGLRALGTNQHPISVGIILLNLLCLKRGTECNSRSSSPINANNKWDLKSHFSHLPLLVRSYTLTKSSSSNCKCSLSSFFSSLDSTGSFSWKAELFREWKLPFQWRWTPVPPPPRWLPPSWPREGPCQPGWLPESPTWAPLETPESTESWRRRDGWCQQSKQKEIRMQIKEKSTQYAEYWKYQVDFLVVQLVFTK